MAFFRIIFIYNVQTITTKLLHHIRYACQNQLKPLRLHTIFTKSRLTQHKAMVRKCTTSWKLVITSLFVRRNQCITTANLGKVFLCGSMTLVIFFRTLMTAVCQIFCKIAGGRKRISNNFLRDIYIKQKANNRKPTTNQVYIYIS